MKKIIYFIFSFLFCTGFMFGQSTGKIFGKVFDSSSKSPVEYANVIVFKSKDSLQVTGGVTNSKGNFSLTRIPFGKFYVDIQFIGYEKKRIKNVLVSSSRKNIDLGNIFIKTSAVNLGNVVVQGERNPVSYKIDRRVIDVSKMPTSISGNAADVLENVPSVSVDIDGNVSLRGSSSFTVLIDGKPSVMDAQDALQQIPASSIESIEIITNPSAKYDPEGSAGIINIKLKKEKNLGLSGIANADACANDKYGGDFLFEYKTPGYNY
ncbi:MAG: TonB-dependent receptor, partial [Ignavibacteriaceae bacterium]